MIAQLPRMGATASVIVTGLVAEPLTGTGVPSAALGVLLALPVTCVDDVADAADGVATVALVVGEIPEPATGVAGWVLLVDRVGVGAEDDGFGGVVVAVRVGVAVGVGVGVGVAVGNATTVELLAE